MTIILDLIQTFKQTFILEECQHENAHDPPVQFKGYKNEHKMLSEFLNS